MGKALRLLVHGNFNVEQCMKFMAAPTLWNFDFSMQMYGADFP